MLWLLALLPAAGGAALWASGVRARRPLGLAAALVLAATAALAGLAAAGGWTGAVAWSGTLQLTAALPPMAAAVALTVPVVALAIAVHAAAHEAADGLARLVGLLLVFVGGMQLVVIAGDLLTLLIGWEIIGACSWALIGHHWREEAAPAAGRYAFVATRLGDLGMFVAAMAAYAGAGAFSYAALSGLPSPYLEVCAFGLVLSAAAKSGQVPFSPWLFRAMAGPTSVSALLHAAALVAAGAYILARLEPTLAAAGAAPAVLAIGLLTALAGGVVGLLQMHGKKLLAASTSAHYGLMFVAVGAGYPGVAILHLIAHAGFKATLFLAVGIAGERAGSFDLDRMGYGRALPLVAAASALGALALAGVPPLGGAWTKEKVVAAAGHAAPWLAVATILAGGLSAAYAAKLQFLAFGRHGPAAADRPAAGERAGLALLAALTLALSLLWLPPVNRWAAAALGAELPPGKAWELVASLAIIALGVFAGWAFARRGASAPGAADWLGLPALIDRTAGAGVPALARAAARLDDRLFDALPRLAGRAGQRIAAGLAEADGRAVDAGVRGTARLSERLARAGDRFGEAASDGLVTVPAALAGQAGRAARRLQTGMSHHYYALGAAGLAAMILVLVLGGL
ncbi:proton-conducting transporter membrane subunit [Aquibium sp. A9E412]|uniref:proton-conducting transporter transmembrane domain-containing protein n=1 Tax=Aquibium sp. A9E412 TaxID=2976767 RepID=UPI0025B01B4E|nr:proton-conducting transporter membrane subunit [Aquibium sp. A9E412]MDN2565522.1 proton-conducting transporter membrane subunit [Aquibium sp. A9E412]